VPGRHPVLVDHFLKKFAGGAVPKAMSKEGLQCLDRYDWPGNVRELENAIERAVILHGATLIDVADLPERRWCRATAARGTWSSRTPR
jgi:DNA-binding NtrC family response regulator